MSRIAMVAGNTVYLLIAQIIIAISTLLISIAIARSLGDVGFGDYSLAITFVALFAIVADLGYDVVLTREVSKDPTKASEYVRNITGLRLLLSIGVFIAIVISINLMGYPEHIRTIVYIFGAYILIVSLSAVYKTAFRAFEVMKYESIVIIIGGVIRLAFGVLVLVLGYGLFALATVFLISGVMELGLSAFICKRKVVRPQIGFSSQFVRSTIRIALPITVFTAMLLILVRIDTILLSLMQGQDVVGWYNAAYNIVLATSFLPMLFLTSLFPTAMRASLESKSLFSIYYQKSVKYLFAVAFPLSLGIALLSAPLIEIIYGPEFVNAVPALQILAWDCCLFFVSGALAHALIGIGKERGVAISAFICIMINLSSNVLLIPIYGYIAAALTTLASEAVLVGLYVYLFKRSLGPMPIHRFVVKPFVASVPMVLPIFFFGGSILIVMPVCIVIYFATFYLIGGLEHSEAVFVRDAFRSISMKIRRTKI